MKRTTTAGFTLIELLTVIAIIALLAAMILGLAGNAQKTAARNRTTAQLETISAFVTEYQMTYGQVPNGFDALSNAMFAAKHAMTNLNDPWGERFVYSNSSKATFYLYSYGGDDSSGRTNKTLWIGNFL